MACPREGTRFRFVPNATSYSMYSVEHRHLLPRSGTIGKAVKMNLGSRTRQTCLPGPGGGLIYVQFPSGTIGVSKYDLQAVAKGELGGARRRRHKGRR